MTKWSEQMKCTISLPIVLMLALTGLAAESVMATEQVPYQVERSLGERTEIRSYGEAIVAETVIDGGDYRDAGNAGFRRLANYIFGGNQGDKRIAMTAPVAMSAESPVSGNNAAQIAQTRDAEGRWRMSFYMPAESTMDSLPRPVDPRVTLRTVAPRTVAAIRFSGRGTSSQFAENEQHLMQILADAGIRSVGKAWTARYNAPWVIPPLRRNEVLIEVAEN